ncbi:glycoside hydrolase family 16 protein [Hypomontagnella submonticulosa]|nr:glycoside hydrolase family 16 protein [Hypomontagnella submonticulosa]
MVASQIHLWTAVLAVLSFITPQAAVAATPVDPSLCHCYLTNGTTGRYFANHKFFDFRNIANPRVPAAIDDRNGATNAPVTNAYFDSTNWTSTWAIQNWVGGSPDASVWQTYSKNDIYIESNTDPNPASRTYLTLRTHRHPAGDFQSSAEFDSVSPNYQYLSLRMYARTRGSAGAVAAMFTYRGGATDADVQEADMEILTKEPANAVHYTNQPSQVGGEARPNATVEVGVPGSWSDWRVHRYDWTPGSSDWYVDGEKVASIQFQAPRDPATLIFNTWSDGGSWSGVMASGNSATMQVQWIELIYNNTAEPSRFSHCANVCTLDVGTQPGVPALLSSGP